MKEVVFYKGLYYEVGKAYRQAYELNKIQIKTDGIDLETFIKLAYTGVIKGEKKMPKEGFVLVIDQEIPGVKIKDETMILFKGLFDKWEANNLVSKGIKYFKSKKYAVFTEYLNPDGSNMLEEHTVYLNGHKFAYDVAKNKQLRLWQMRQVTQSLASMMEHISNDKLSVYYSFPTSEILEKHHIMYIDHIPCNLQPDTI